eukprot:10258560-Heterocapsa_arctica.AAC.1
MAAVTCAALLRLSRRLCRAGCPSAFLRRPQAQHILQVNMARAAESLGQHVRSVVGGADDAQLE